MSAHSRVVAIMPARNVARTLRAAVEHIPSGCIDEIVLVDNHSHDDTASLAEELGLRVVRHDRDRGYGGSLKTCLKTALEIGADLVVEIHPDDQYDCSVVPELLRTARESGCAIVVGSRFTPPSRALDGGMPRWKYAGNRMLSWLNRRLLGVALTDFHSGLRVYSARFLRHLPFERFSNDFAFSFQILAAAVGQPVGLREVAASSRYFAEASSNDVVGSIKYGLATLATSVRARRRR